MKRLWIIAFLLISTVSWAKEPIILAKTSQGIAGASIAAATSINYCNSGTTCGTPPQYCDTLCEDFEGSTECFSGYDSVCQSATSNTYKAGTDTIDFTTTASGTYPCATTRNTNVLTITSSTGGNTTGMRWTAASDLTAAKGQFYFNIVSITLANTNSETIFQVYENTGATAVLTIAIYRGVDSKLYFVVASAGMTQIQGPEISTDTWYRLGYAADEAADTLSFYVNGTTIGTAIDFTSSTAMRRYYFGVNTGAKQATAFVKQYDNIAVHTTTAPSACSN